MFSLMKCASMCVCVWTCAACFAWFFGRLCSLLCLLLFFFVCCLFALFIVSHFFFFIFMALTLVESRTIEPIARRCELGKSPLLSCTRLWLCIFFSFALCPFASAALYRMHKFIAASAASANCPHPFIYCSSLSVSQSTACCLCACVIRHSLNNLINLRIAFVGFVGHSPCAVAFCEFEAQPLCDISEGVKSFFWWKAFCYSLLIRKFVA